MIPTPITKKQFVDWLIVFTIGMALWAAPGNLIWVPGLGIVIFGNFILMARRERSRPLPVREVAWIVVGLFVFAALMVASKWWLPDDFVAPIARFIRHPVFVAVPWAFTVWLNYRSYRIKKTDAQHAT